MYVVATYPHVHVLDIHMQDALLNGYNDYSPHMYAQKGVKQSV